MTKSTELKAALATAISTAEAAAVAKSSLESLLVSALSAVLHDGADIDLRRRPGMPEHLVGVRTIKGNDRGTRLFRQVGAVVVDLHPIHFSGAKWECRAVPVSEKTGKDMSGATHGADSRETVRLRGDIFALTLHDDRTDEARIERLLSAVAEPVSARVVAEEPRRAEPSVR